MYSFRNDSELSIEKNKLTVSRMSFKVRQANRFGEILKNNKKHLSDVLCIYFQRSVDLSDYRLYRHTLLTEL